MRKGHGLALGVLLGATALVLIVSSPAQSQKAAPVDGITGKLMKATNLPEKDVTKLYEALGPVLRDELKQGRNVSLPGLGSFRIVRVGAHRDMIDGRVVTVPARNTVEFVGGDDLLDAANTEGVVPAEEVPPFEYVPLPGQTPGQKVGPARAPGRRMP